jgi:hypothetical protein
VITDLPSTFSGRRSTTRFQRLEHFCGVCGRMSGTTWANSRYNGHPKSAKSTAVAFELVGGLAAVYWVLTVEKLTSRVENAGRGSAVVPCTETRQAVAGAETKIHEISCGYLVQLGGLEPPTSWSTAKRSNQLSYSCTRRGSRRNLRAPSCFDKTPAVIPVHGSLQRTWRHRS